MDHRTELYSVLSKVFPMFDAITEVRVEADSKMDFGTFLVFPITMDTASASPMALVSPRIIPVIIPDFPAGTRTL